MQIYAWSCCPSFSLTQLCIVDCPQIRYLFDQENMHHNVLFLRGCKTLRTQNNAAHLVPPCGEQLLFQMDRRMPRSVAESAGKQLSDFMEEKRQRFANKVSGSFRRTFIQKDTKGCAAPAFVTTERWLSMHPQRND